MLAMKRSFRGAAPRHSLSSWPSPASCSALLSTLSSSPVRRQAEIEELLLSELRGVQDPLLEGLPRSQAPSIVAQGYVERIRVDEGQKRVDLELKL